MIDVSNVVNNSPYITSANLYSYHLAGITERCFYHPAPLTKRNTEDDVIRDGDTAAALRPAKRKRNSKSLPVSEPTMFSIHERLPDAVHMTANQPGYLGPTSYSAILPKDEANAVIIDREASVASDGSDYEMAHQHPLTKSMRIQMATEVLRCLRHYPIIRELANILKQVSQSCIVSSSPPVRVENMSVVGANFVGTTSTRA